MRVNNGEKWIKILPELKDNLAAPQAIQCPNCGEHGDEYLYIGDKKKQGQDIFKFGVVNV